MIETMERLRSLLPPEVQREMAEAEKKRAALARQFNVECVETISALTDAMRFPNIGRSAVEEANRRLQRALSIVAVLDPEDV
jgi:hypothetical protein